MKSIVIATVLAVATCSIVANDHTGEKLTAENRSYQFKSETVTAHKGEQAIYTADAKQQQTIAVTMNKDFLDQLSAVTDKELIIRTLD